MSLDAEIIFENLNDNTKNIFSDITVLSSTTSTNDVISSLLEISPQKNVVFAEAQTQGRGQRGRTWVSPPESNIYFSLSWNFKKNIADLSGLSLVTAIAIVRALKNHGIREVIQIKWPNDLFFEHKKLGGILIESTAREDNHCWVMIGMGINVNSENKDVLNIDQPWTSLYEITKIIYDRNALSAAFLNELNTVLTEFEKSGLKKFLPEWEKYDALLGRTCEIETPKNVITGVCMGIQTDGALLLKTNGDCIEVIHSGSIIKYA